MRQCIDDTVTINTPNRTPVKPIDYDNNVSVLQPDDVYDELENLKNALIDAEVTSLDSSLHLELQKIYSCPIIGKSQSPLQGVTGLKKDNTTPTTTPTTPVSPTSVIGSAMS